MDRDEEDWLEAILQESARRKSVRKILKVDKKCAVSKGDNYTSELSRLVLRVQQVDGQVVNRWAIYKNLPPGPHMRYFMKESGLFTTEVKIYNEVLPKLEQIRLDKEFGESLWGECYGVKGYETLLLEDLAVKGYKMGQRKKGLDFDHCSLVMRGLGKFHALTAILKERGDLVVSDFDQHLIQRKMDTMGKFYDVGFENLAKTIESTWGEEWAPYAPAVRKLLKTLTENMIKSMNRDKKNKFYVLNHGDCWVNNCLFRYGPDERPVSVKFIDFQACFYNQNGFDLEYFFSTSPDMETRVRFDELLQLYYDSLVSSLQLFGYGGSLPTMEDIQDGRRTALLFGMASAVSILPLIMTNAEDVPDHEALLQKHNATPESDMGELLTSQEFIEATVPKTSEDYNRAMKYLLLYYKDNGIVKL